uniref:Interferon alpha inducible protein 27 like 2 n=1 Tax=Rousettus aegyptiacus TaxID=9407 RepID=A0A7J8IL19_ROUAE|nr:interferon alpha inducible protein 27 like 2 [Rousettus aegyptiacus]
MIKRAAAAVIGGVVAVGAVPAVLGAAGFTSAGIAASSLAAKMMSAAAIANGGGVAAGSLVATLQSVAFSPQSRALWLRDLEEGSRWDLWALGTGHCTVPMLTLCPFPRGSRTFYVIQHPPGLHWVSFRGLARKFKKGTTFLSLGWTQG